MTRVLTILCIALFALAGCTSTRVQTSTTREIDSAWDRDASTASKINRYPTRASSALAFSAPISRSNPALDLYRDQRQPGAFVGYESTTVSYRWVRTDDRQSHGPWYGGWGNAYGSGSWHGDRFDRRAVTVEESVRVRN
jgi:hypothetical protein